LTEDERFRPILPGEPPVKSQCLPFSQIPHTTQLFTDFLAYLPKVQQFYPRSPRISDWLQDKTAVPRYDSVRRERVASILESQNRNWESSPKALENIARLRAGASVVVTGQQVGLFGGPLFAMFKALTAVKLAEEASRNGVDCVPVFWLATEDHDLAEVNHTSILSDASLHKLTTATQGVSGAPVGAVKFGAEIESVVGAAVELMGESEATEFLRETYRLGETFGSAFARLFARLFADWGVILLDAADPDLHVIAEPIYHSAIERAVELDDALLTRGKALESAGYHQQVKVTPSSTLVFALHHGSRVPIHRRENGNSQTEFVIGEETVSQAELFRRIAAGSQNFSANVLLRPVVQDYLLPTLAYTGGSAEVAYFAQAAVVYEALPGRVTPIIPRFSATLVETKSKALLERYGLTLPDLFHGPEALREVLATRVLPQDLQRAFGEAETRLESCLADIRASLAQLDKTLVDSATHAGEKMRYQLGQLRSRAARSEVRQTEILSRHAELLSRSLYPDKTLQEREVAGVCFVARHGTQFLHELYDSIRLDCLDHQIVAF
jgi:bacillithiol biosynthesis cysteine-adding enzyme BshC